VEALGLVERTKNWLKSLLASDPDAIGHETVNDVIVFTASPKELQQFVLKHSADGKAFAAVIHLTRHGVAAE
jgi:hypothetical protein